MTYHERDRWLMRYEGLSNLRNEGGEALTVPIDLPLSERNDWSPAGPSPEKVAAYEGQ